MLDLYSAFQHQVSLIELGLLFSNRDGFLQSIY